MNENIKIDEKEYAYMIEQAKKTLETMSQESIEELRTKCKEEIRKLTKVLESDATKARELVAKLGEDTTDYKKDNPLKKAKRNFWLGQIANFISVTIFKLPREFTPSYEYARGSSKEFEKQAKSIDDRLNSLAREGKVLSESTLSGLYEISRNIASDNEKLIVFCNACNDINAPIDKIAVSPHFSKIASILYQNNVSFPAKIYRTSSTQTHISEGVDSMIEVVNNSYSKARGNEVIKEY